LKLDLHNTGSIVKAFVRQGGTDIYPQYPLRYRDRIFANTLMALTEQPPGDAGLQEWHGWTLKRWKGVMLLTRYLWKDASIENRLQAKKIFEEYVKSLFKIYYIPEQGAFSYYPDSKKATLDGTGNGISSLELVGAFSPKKQRRLWGSPEKTCSDLGKLRVNEPTGKDLDTIRTTKDVNSWRIYTVKPDSDNYTKNVAGIIYPKTNSIPDIMELVPKLKTWISSTSQSMGNWVSREKILRDLSVNMTKRVPVIKGDISIELLDTHLKKNKTVTLIGFDVLQVPRYTVTFF